MVSSNGILSAIALLFHSVAVVSAHGFVYQVSIDGKMYTGNIPGAKPSSPSVIREISMQDPVKGATNPFVNCGNDAQIAALQVANAHPGSSVSFDWRTADLGKWPHNTGPMLTYMASCGSTPCTTFNSSNASWFKIQQVGKKDDTTWAQQDIMDGKTADIVLPATLAPGFWLLRHEIIALHLATSPGGAEFYPSCTQLQVDGNQTGGPDPDELVKLPGAYSDDDPGIYDPDVYDDGAEYQFPGPNVAKFVQASANTGSTSGSGAQVPTRSIQTSTGLHPTDAPNPSSSQSASSFDGKCRLTKPILSSISVAKQTRLAALHNLGRRVLGKHS
ncbi:glycosyl hydrolase family 61-domain-containing protein [Mycena floridula]|nr:glycosyl hydrolase family 61-domain-containing protein [Mycena floridula]